MDKTAFKAQLKNFAAKAKTVIKHPVFKKGVIGGGIGASAGGMAGLGAEARLKNHESYKKLDPAGKKRALTNLKSAKRKAVIYGGVGGALYGASEGLGDAARGSYRAGYHYHGGGGASSGPSYSTHVPDWLKGVKTKAEATSKFKEVGKKHHPDMGGDAEKFKNYSAEWTAFKKHHFDKLSFVLPSLWDELASIYRETSR